MDDVAERIEHTVLGPRTRWSDVATVLDEAIRLGMRACVPPWAVEQAREYAPGVSLTTVVSFPHGQAATETKIAAGRSAWLLGANELGVVVNHGHLAGKTDAFKADLAEVVATVPIPVTVIIEASLLEAHELRQIGEDAHAANAAFLKTGAGFADGGATVDTVTLLSQYLPVNAHCIESWSQAAALFEAGAERISTPDGAMIVEEFRANADDVSSG